jgi:hypothetical protein
MAHRKVAGSREPQIFGCHKKSHMRKPPTDNLNRLVVASVINDYDFETRPMRETIDAA